MDTMDTASIADIITEHGDYVGVDYHMLPADEFTESFGHLPTARFGWTWPEIGVASDSSTHALNRERSR